MVTLDKAIASNERIAATFPQGLVAVFVGGTSGVGEYTVKAFARRARNSRAYIIGRSGASAQRIMDECRTLGGPSNSFEFMQGDISLLKVVDNICRRIREKETAINILFQTQGSMAFSAVTSEDIPLAVSLGIHSRVRFILNLLPLLQHAGTSSPSLRRIVCVMAATCEGPIDLDNLAGIGFSLRKRRDQLASAQTLLLEKVAAAANAANSKAAPIGFVHDVPGVVQSGITRDVESFGLKMLIAVTNLLGPWIRTPIDECAEMHLFFATSARFAGDPNGMPDGVALKGIHVARGSSGQVGSGVYTIDNKGESSPTRVEDVLAGLRADGTAEKLWELVLADMRRVTGVESI